MERDDAEYPGWYWCRTDSGRSGWVHRSFLADVSGKTTALRAYSAHELTVTAGERGEVIHSLDGWLYVRLAGGDEGWIPESHVTPEA